MVADVVLLGSVGLRLDDAVVSFTLHFLPKDNPFKDLNNYCINKIHL